MTSNFSIKDIQVFVKIIECGSFKGAANLLHVTQSALTQRLKKLEESLGARLIDRTTRHVAPTAVGRTFLPSARRLAAQFDQAIADIRDVVTASGGRITIASLISVATYILPPVIRNFAAAHPNVGVRVLDEAEQEILQHVRRGDAEFAIDMLTGEPDPDFNFTPLLDDRFVMTCRADHPLAGGEGVTWEALTGMPVIMLGPQSGTSRLILSHLSDRPRSTAWLNEVQHLSTLLGFVEAGLGVGIVPSMVMQAQFSRGLAARPMIEPDLTRRIVLVERKNTTLSPAAANLKNLLVEECMYPKEI